MILKKEWNNIPNETVFAAVQAFPNFYNRLRRVVKAEGSHIFSKHFVITSAWLFMIVISVISINILIYVVFCNSMYFAMLKFSVVLQACFEIQ